jgi:hypothetical protein
LLQVVAVPQEMRAISVVAVVVVVVCVPLQVSPL